MRRNPYITGNSGFILGVVLLAVLVVGVFLFAFHSHMSQQNRQAHHERFSTIAGMTALSAANLVLDFLGSDNGTVIDSISLGIRNEAIVPDIVFDNRNNSIVNEIMDDLNTGIAQGNIGDTNLPVCTLLKLSFSDIRALNPDTTDQQLSECRDPVEKQGNITVECIVEYRGLSRSASVKRSFKVVSMVPGVFARFTLFVPETPWYNSYNSLGVQITGEMDQSYIHKYGVNVHYEGPLKVFNGPQAGSAQPDVQSDLSTRGWIFLGPTPDGKNVILRIPSGYNDPAGGHFMLCPTPGKTIHTNQLTVISEKIDLPNLFDPSPNGVTCTLLRIFNGYFIGLHNGQEAFWPAISTDWHSAASWLMPFGDYQTGPSRTLMIGPVLAGFLSLCALCDTPPASTWEHPLTNLSYSNLTPVNDKSGTELFKYQDYFKQGMVSYAMTVPTQFSADDGSNPVSFNTLFECLQNNNQYPVWGNGSTLIAATGDPFFAPNYDTINSNAVPGIHGHENASIFFTQGSQDPDNTYFKGNLCEYVPEPQKIKNLAQRTTHVIDLRNCQAGDENNAFADALFIQNSQDFRIRKSGIFYVIRNQSSGNPLSLPQAQGKPLVIDKSAVIIVEKGGILIPGVISQDATTAKADDKLLTLIALEGDIFLETGATQINAYLTALNPSNNGGKLLAQGNICEMNIFGGIAIHSMGVKELGTERSTMSDFHRGGKIEYNTAFNPSASTYGDSRKMIINNTSQQTEIKAGQ